MTGGVTGGVPDGTVGERVADRLALQDLVTAYAYAVDDGDWVRWEGLFEPDARIDYTAAGGIAGTPAELAAWMPASLSVFAFSLHTTSTHEVRFTGPDTATGRVHVLNRNGVVWEGRSELVDVGAVYEDAYVLREGRWRFASRVEHTAYVSGGVLEPGGFAAVVRDLARDVSGTAPFG